MLACTALLSSGSTLLRVKADLGGDTLRAGQVTNKIGKLTPPTTWTPIKAYWSYPSEHISLQLSDYCVMMSEDSVVPFCQLIFGGKQCPFHTLAAELAPSDPAGKVLFLNILVWTRFPPDYLQQVPYFRGFLSPANLWLESL